MEAKDLEPAERRSATPPPETIEGRWPLSDPEETLAVERVRPRIVTDDQWKRFEDAVGEMFEAFGMDLATEGTENTPHRFVRALFEATSGYEGDPEAPGPRSPPNVTAAPTGRISQVIEGPIPFFSLCEHHAFPLYGVAHGGYVAHEQIIGISKMTRLVRGTRGASPCRNASASRSPTT